MANRYSDASLKFRDAFQRHRRVAEAYRGIAAAREGISQRCSDPVLGYRDTAIACGGIILSLKGIVLSHSDTSVRCSFNFLSHLTAAPGSITSLNRGDHRPDVTGGDYNVISIALHGMRKIIRGAV